MLSRTAINLGLLAGLTSTAYGQNPVAPPAIPWTPYTQAPPATPAIPSGSIPAAPISSQPKLVPQTLTYHKNSVAPPVEPSLPPLGVPALPTSVVRTPVVDVPPIVIDRAPATIAAIQSDPPRPASLPGADPLRAVVFRLDGDDVLNRRIQKELGDKNDPFPTPATLEAASAPYVPKTVSYPPMQAKLEPAFIIHRRLYFEEKNSERAGWDLGAIQPIVSAGAFVRDFVWLPHNVASGFWKNRWDTNVGKCQPGSPTPYYLYPHGYTVSGLMWQVPVTVGLVFILP